MKLRIAEAMELLMFRTKKSPKEITWQWLGSIIHTKSSYHSIATLMLRLRDGSKKSLSFDAIAKMCQALKVDPNFLFGWPSTHDKSYREMVKEKKEKSKKKDYDLKVLKRWTQKD